jgi:ATP-binding cassette, subfamily B, bacterial MsbA
VNEFFSRVWGLVHPYKGRLILGIVFGILSGFVAPLLVLTIKLAVSVIFPTAQDISLLEQLEAAPRFVQNLVGNLSSVLPQKFSDVSTAGLLLIIACIPAVMVIKGITSYVNIYMMQWVGVRAIMDLRNRLFSHFMSHSASFFNKGNTGELISRIFNDTAFLQNSITNSVPTIVRDPITIIALSSYLLWSYTTLTLITLVVFPLCVIPVLIYSQNIRRAMVAMQNTLAALGKVMQETFTGNRIIKAYNLEKFVRKKFEENSRTQVSLHMKCVRGNEVPGILIEILGATGVALVLVYIRIMGKIEMSPADFMAFIGSFFLMYQPIKSLSKIYTQLNQAAASSKRVFELLDIKSEIAEPLQPKLLQAQNAEIVFEQVSFSYGDRNVISDINIRIKPGQRIALVGATGSGKSTLMHLILRFYDPVSGRITIGGTDIRDVSTHHLHEQIAIVTQDTFLFDDTIRNNIAYGKPDATFEEIQRAAKLALAEEFILQKKEGYDTLVGERGVMLSGGQRQRLAIARALLRNAPILLLDEATSALDTNSERIVQAALEELMKGRTSICIAHRLSTIYDSDLIFVLDSGKIVESGTHERLLSQNGIYRKLYDLQFTQLN